MISVDWPECAAVVDGTDGAYCARRQENGCPVHDREWFRHGFAYETDPDLGAVGGFMIGREFLTVLRTKPIPILVPWEVSQIVMAKPSESGGFAHHDHGRELETLSTLADLDVIGPFCPESATATS